MKKRFWLLTSLSILLASSELAFAQGAETAELIMDKHFQSAAARKWFSGSVLVYKDNKVILSKGYGWADLENQVGNTPSTRFRIASLTKQFTAAAVLLLQESGQLRVSDPIAKYFPTFPNAERITIHHLLSHTSGIMEISTLKEIDSLTLNSVGVDFYIRYIQNRPLDFEPGTKFKYSNTGYMMLTRIIETASGKSYITFLSEKIFGPLGMTNTGIDDAEEIIQQRAHGYTFRGDQLRNAPYVYMKALGGAGCLYSTVEDLMKWHKCMKEKKVLSTASWEVMVTPNLNNYGYGLFLSEIGKRKVAVHSGGVQGFAAQYIYYTEENALVVILKNYENAPRIFSPQGMVHSILFNEPYTFPEERKSITLSASAVALLVGEYEFPQGFKLTITTEKARIFVQIQGQPKLETFAESESVLFFREIEATCEVQRDIKGVTGLILKQNGREFSLRKTR